MKKFFSQMLAVSMVLLLFQCDRKEDISPSTYVNFADYLSTPEFVPLPELDSYRVPKEEVRAKIRSYLSQRNSRTNAEFPTSEAIWYIETLPNYFQGKANVSYKELILTEHLYYLGSDANAMVSSAQIDELAATIEMQAVSDKNAAQISRHE